MEDGRGQVLELSCRVDAQRLGGKMELVVKVLGGKDIA